MVQLDALVKNLRAVLRPEQVVSDPGELLVFECDGLTHYRHRPRAVVFPVSTEEVSEVMRLLARERVAVVPRGAGTGLSGGALAVGGGVCVELARMRRVLKIDVENRLAVVEAGVVHAPVSRVVAPRRPRLPCGRSSRTSPTLTTRVVPSLPSSPQAFFPRRLRWLTARRYALSRRASSRRGCRRTRRARCSSNSTASKRALTKTLRASVRFARRAARAPSVSPPTSRSGSVCGRRARARSARWAASRPTY